MEFEFDLELDKIKKKIEEIGAKKVLIQLPDGLKPLATKIVDELSTKDIEIFIWNGSCFGACDILDVKGFDLIIQFGHNQFRQ